ncbi:MAG: hypothetical protein J6X43_11800 [Bacteroidales bacterium]|nr:hypothetical protein [Bacteroidales bacterium]
MKKLIFTFGTIICTMGLHNVCVAQCDCGSYNDCKQKASAYRSAANTQYANGNRDGYQRYKGWADWYEQCAQEFLRSMNSEQRQQQQLEMQQQQLEIQRQQQRQQQEMYNYYRYGY